MEKLGRHVAKLRRIVGVANVGRDYHLVKKTCLELQVDVGLLLDSSLTDAERRKPDVVIVTDSFNVQVAMLRDLLKAEHHYPFLQLQEERKPEEAEFKPSSLILEASEYREEDYRMSAEEIRKVKSIIQTCNELTSDQLRMMQEEGETLERAGHRVEETVEDSRRAGEELKAAAKHKSKGLKMKLGLVMGGIGAAVGGVLGFGVGAVAGGAGGIALGTTIGSKIDKVVKKKHNQIEFEGAQ